MWILFCTLVMNVSSSPMVVKSAKSKLTTTPATMRRKGGETHHPTTTTSTRKLPWNGSNPTAISTTKTYDPSVSILVSSLLTISGGGSSDSTAATAMQQKRKRFKKFLLPSTILLLLLHQSWIHRSQLYQLFDSTSLRTQTVQLLSQIEQSLGPWALPCYSLLFCFWEALGLSSIPVETAAGMAFGFRSALFASAIGKMTGAVLAYIIGRTYLRSNVSRRLSDINIISLAQSTTTRHPFRNAILMRYSCLPEFVKNYGLAILDPITYPIFISAVACHGWPFTLLWTCVGWDMAQRLKQGGGGEMPMMTTGKKNNGILSLLLLLTTTFGIVGSPAIMAFWVKEMRAEQKLYEKTK